MEVDTYEYESRFGGGNTEDFYPNFPDVESAIKYFAIDKEDKKDEDLQSLASKEFCRNETELLSSKTASRIIKIAETEKLARDIQTLTLDEPEKIATGPSLLSEVLKIGKKPAKSECYNRFINGEPISKAERNYLITLFKNPEIITIILDTLSKINILYGPENKELIKKFLENEKGEYDISNPLRYILYNLENYPFVVDFSFDEITPYKYLINYPVGGKYFTYKKGNKSGFILKFNDKLYYLTTLFDKIKILSNGLIFGSVNKKDDIEGNNIGELYSFNGVGFDLVYGEKGFIDIYESSEGFTVKGENNKYGLLQVNEIKKDILEEALLDRYNEKFINLNNEFKVEKVLDTSFDKITLKNGLIFGFNKEKNHGFGKLEIYKNIKTDFNKTPFQIKDSILKLLELDHVTFHSHFKRLDIEFYDNGKLIDIQTLEGHNFYYFFKEENNKLTPIGGLQGINIEHVEIDSKLLSGLPVVIQDNKNIQYVITFDKTTLNVSNIIKGIGKYVYIVNELYNLNLGFAILESKKNCFILKNNGRLYCLKSGYKAFHEDGMSSFYVKKSFFSKKTFVYSDEELLQYADLVSSENLPIEIK